MVSVAILNPIKLAVKMKYPSILLVFLSVILSVFLSYLTALAKTLSINFNNSGERNHPEAGDCYHCYADLELPM